MAIVNSQISLCSQCAGNVRLIGNGEAAIARTNLSDAAVRELDDGSHETTCDSCATVFSVRVYKTDCDEYCGAWGEECHCPEMFPSTDIERCEGTYMPACVAEYVRADLMSWVPPTEPQDWSDWSY